MNNVLARARSICTILMLEDDLLELNGISTPCADLLADLFGHMPLISEFQQRLSIPCVGFYFSVLKIFFFLRVGIIKQQTRKETK